MEFETTMENTKNLRWFRLEPVPTGEKQMVGPLISRAVAMVEELEPGDTVVVTVTKKQK